MRTKSCLYVAACVVVWAALPTLPAAGRPSHHHRRTVARVVPAPSQDAVELATLAPPSRLSTLEQTYGDAAYARARLERRIAREEQADAATIAASGGAPYPCDPRRPTAAAYVCNGAPDAVSGRERSYGQGYAFTPSYLSAPQRLAVPADEQTQILPPFTALSWAANSLRYDPHN